MKYFGLQQLRWVIGGDTGFYQGGDLQCGKSYCAVSVQAQYQGSKKMLQDGWTVNHTLFNIHMNGIRPLRAIPFGSWLPMSRIPGIFHLRFCQSL
jgi:hypothetical protein